MHLQTYKHKWSGYIGHEREISREYVYCWVIGKYIEVLLLKCLEHKWCVQAYDLMLSQEWQMCAMSITHS